MRFINKFKDDKLLVLIICCWILLIVCFLIKLFGGNWFEIATNNRNFINACNFVDKHYIVQTIISSILYCFNGYLVYLVMTKYKIGKDLWLIILCIPTSFLKDEFQIIGIIYEIILIIVLPIVILYIRKNKEERIWKNILRIIAINLIILIFQFLSLITKNIGFTLENQTTLVALIYQIDYYIMLILYYLHMRRYYKRREV